MKVTDGHLTQGNKVAIKAILDAGLTTGKVGRTTYVLSTNDRRSYNVAILNKQRNCIGADLAVTRYESSFTL